MRPQWPLLCLVLLLVTPASTLAGDYRLLNVGVRGGVNGLPVLGKHEHEDFQQYDLFATASLPFSKYWESGWGFSTRLMGTAGALTAAGDTGFVGSIVPLLALGPKDSILSLDAGVGAALISRYKFGEQSFGGVFEFVLTFGLRVPVYRGLGVGYRFAHMSDATIYGSSSRGVDMHMLELTYTFR
jgi:Lipid A 3-O-deacylase (PagL)